MMPPNEDTTVVPDPVTKGNSSGETYVADEKLWATVDGKVVKDGDPAAAVLLITPGMEIPLEEAQAKGLVTKAPKKQASKPSDKRRKPAAKNKARK